MPDLDKGPVGHNRNRVRIYRHNTTVYLAIPALILVELYLAYATWTFEGELRGGEAMRYGLVGGCLFFAVLTTWLYLRFAVVRYCTADAGIVVKGLFATKTRLWQEIATLKVNRHLKYLAVRDDCGKLVVFTSTDYFRGINDMIQQIEARMPDPH